MVQNSKLLFYVKRKNEKIHPTQHLFAAQLARECMIDAGEGDESLQIIDNNGVIHPNHGI